MTKRRTLATGIYEDKYGRAVRWRDRGVPREQRFDLDTPLETLTAFRKRKLQQAQPAPKDTDGRFVRDVVRFLRMRRHMPSFKSDRAHLRAWVHRFRRLSRWMITREKIQQAIDEWAARGYSPRELRHRRNILKRFFRVLNQEQATPCDGVKVPTIIRRKPRPVDLSIIRDVALNLRKQEICGKLRDAKTRARFLLLTLTGIRPAQLMRTVPERDIDWTRGLWYVDPAKGDEGTIVTLNVQIRAALLVFTTAHAQGPYDSRSFSKTIKRNGWPKGVRPYQLRHTVGQTLKELGVPLGGIQDHMGHASPTTTSEFYLGPSLEQLRDISAKLDGRLDPFAVELSHADSVTIGAEQKAKEDENPRHFDLRHTVEKAADRRGKSRKKA